MSGLSKPTLVPGDPKSLKVRWIGRIDYLQALAQQDEQVARRMGEESCRDLLLLLEHDPVYTIGRTPDRSSLPEPRTLPHQLVETNRGGEATYHGPGQLVGYPILDLRRHGKDLHALLRWQETALITALAGYEVHARRSEGLTGVWVEDRKIASIGVGVRRWISMHGFALNVNGDLTPFDEIVPCGIEGVRMTSLERELPEKAPCPTVEEFAATVGTVFEETLGELEATT